MLAESISQPLLTCFIIVQSQQQKIPEQLLKYVED